MWAYGWSPDLSRKVSTFSEIALSISGIKSSMSFNCSRSTLESITDWFTMMLTSFPTYSLYQLSYTCNFLNHITLPFAFCSQILSITMALQILSGVLASIRIICCQRYVQPLSEYFWMLAASSQTYQPFPEYLRRSPVKSFTGLWHLWNQIIQLMQFSRYKREFLNILSLITAWKHQNVVRFKKILSLIRRYRGTFDTLFWKIHKKFTFASFISL